MDPVTIMRIARGYHHHKGANPFNYRWFGRGSKYQYPMFQQDSNDYYTRVAPIDAFASDERRYANEDYSADFVATDQPEFRFEMYGFRTLHTLRAYTGQIRAFARGVNQLTLAPPNTEDFRDLWIAFGPERDEIKKYVGAVLL